MFIIMNCPAFIIMFIYNNSIIISVIKHQGEDFLLFHFICSTFPSSNTLCLTNSETVSSLVFCFVLTFLLLVLFCFFLFNFFGCSLFDLFTFCLFCSVWVFFFSFFFPFFFSFWVCVCVGGGLVCVFFSFLFRGEGRGIGCFFLFFFCFQDQLHTDVWFPFKKFF